MFVNIILVVACFKFDILTTTATWWILLASFDKFDTRVYLFQFAYKRMFQKSNNNWYTSITDIQTYSKITPYRKIFIEIYSLNIKRD